MPKAPEVEAPPAHIRHARFDLNPWTESLDARRAAIQAIVAERGISALYHFTRIENVPSILELGLLPRNRLPPEALVSDDRRLDQREDTCSISISHPNALMFYAKRTQTGDERWAVLELEPSVLWEKPCLFFTRNAATCGAARTPDCDIETSWALREMFRRRDETASLANFLTTDPQAEVLVRGPIERRYIRRAHVLGSTWGPEHAIPGIAWVRTPALFHVHPAY